MSSTPLGGRKRYPKAGPGGCGTAVAPSACATAGHGSAASARSRSNATMAWRGIITCGVGGCVAVGQEHPGNGPRGQLQDLGGVVSSDMHGHHACVSVLCERVHRVRSSPVGASSLLTSPPHGIAHQCCTCALGVVLQSAGHRMPAVPERFGLCANSGCFGKLVSCSELCSAGRVATGCTNALRLVDHGLADARSWFHSAWSATKPCAGRIFTPHAHITSHNKLMRSENMACIALHHNPN